MAIIRVTTVLPYFLTLPEGEYTTPAAGGSVHLGLGSSGAAGGPTDEPRTEASSTFDCGGANEPEAIEKRRDAEAVRLLRRINMLLRWYRALSGGADVLELSRAQAAPFAFADEQTGENWGGTPLQFQLPPTPAVDKTRSKLGDEVRAGLANGNEPDVGELNILDAEHAMHTGRFREAVLLAWSAIDATFAQGYERAMSPHLGGEYSDGRKFVLGHDIPMKVRMTAMLYLGVKQSLYRTLGDEWNRLAASYDNRNNVIHRGKTATQEEAEQAIGVARRVTAIARTL